MPDRRAPLYDVHVRAGAKMIKGGGDLMITNRSHSHEHIP